MPDRTTARSPSRSRPSPATDTEPSLQPMNEFLLHTSDGMVLAVPPSLSAITTYVLLEQEAWFEKEVAFLHRWIHPGMSVIDIGANVGVYSVPLAGLVGPTGRVFAFEPASEPRGLLERSRVVNRLDNLEILAAALSDGEREGTLSLGTSSELNSLSGTGSGERVRITSLDAQELERGWRSPDFVKIDAEGEENRILAGGRNFFSRHSPLVMFEIRAGNAINRSLGPAFAAMGYDLFRLLPESSVLVPCAPHDDVDGFELNLFAAKPDRAAELAAAGLLVRSVPDWAPSDEARRHALALLRAQPFAPAFAAALQDEALLDPRYRDGLAAYAVWRSAERPLPERYAALIFACRALLERCQTAATLPRILTFARIAWEAGQRAACSQALQIAVTEARRGNFEIKEPFWPASPRFDALQPAGRESDWLIASAVELFERAAKFSSLFAPACPELEWLCHQPFASAEMERRRVLSAAIRGERIKVPTRLRSPASDHLNAAIWESGRVPGTWVDAAAASH
jgi:FkbM family methyltransferase